MKKPEEANTSTESFVFWLSQESPSSKFGEVTIGYGACNGDNLPLLISADQAIPGCRMAKNLSYVLTTRLNEEIALREHLTLSLARLILPSTAQDYSDQHVLPESMMWSSFEDGEVQKNIKQEGGTSPYVIIFFILSLVAERVVAYKRNQ